MTNLSVNEDNKKYKIDNAYDHDSEMQLLGMLINHNHNINNTSWLPKEAFHFKINGIIYDAIHRLYDKYQSVDVKSLRLFLENHQIFQEVKDADYLLSASQAISFSTPKMLADTLHSLWLKRKLIITAHDISNAAIESTPLDIKTAIAKAEEQIYGLNIRRNDLVVHNPSDIVDQVMLDFEEIIFSNVNKKIKTGLFELDELIGGFKKGDLVVLGARSSVGKTTMALNIAYNMVQREEGVLFFSLEMTKEDLMNKIIALHANLNAKMLDTGTHVGGEEHGRKLDRDEYEEVLYKAAEIKTFPLYIQDNSTITLSNIRSIGRKFKQDKHIKLIVIDYIQLIKSTNDDRNKTDAGRLSEIANGLKALAKELDLPIMALSQVSRGVEQRDNKKPMLSDLKESGGIEEASDLVLLLYRESYYLERNQPEYPGSAPVRMLGESTEESHDRQSSYAEKALKYKEWKEKYDLVKDKAEVIVAKNRKGSIGTVNVLFDKNKGKFKSDPPIVTTVKVPVEVKPQMQRADWDNNTEKNDTEQAEMDIPF